MKRYYSLNFRIIPEANVWHFCLETEKTATLGKNRYTVTDSMSRSIWLFAESCETKILVALSQVMLPTELVEIVQYIN